VKLPILAIQDAHAAEDAEFAEQGLKPHAILGTEGQQKIFESLAPLGTPILPPSGKRSPWPEIRKIASRGGTVILEKIAFDAFSNPAMKEIASNYEVSEMVLFGATLEHDVAALANSARLIGYEVTVIEDATGSLTKDVQIEARGALRRRGVRFEPAEETCIRMEQWGRK